jgi:LDH2 family malate/lactate/ureidoglycolate dehydrogenase
MVEVLGGPLVGAAYAQLEGEWGSLFMAIDPDLLMDVEDFKVNCSDLIQKVKNARKAEDVNEVRLPGERARKTREQAEATGLVDVDETILKELGYI